MAHLLHVEDDDRWQGLVKRYLESLGHTVTSFYQLSKAKTAFNNDPSKFDIILCDGSIEESGDGEEWAKELYREGYKVIIISGTSTSSDIPFVKKVVISDDILRKEINKLLLKR